MGIGNDSFIESRYALIKRGDGSDGRRTPFPYDVLEPIKKRSLCFALRNEKQAAYKLLSCFALRDINVLKVETRPLSGNHAPGFPTETAQLWDYYFYVDYEVPALQTSDDAAKLELRRRLSLGMTWWISGASRDLHNLCVTVLNKK